MIEFPAVVPAPRAPRQAANNSAPAAPGQVITDFFRNDLAPAPEKPKALATPQARAPPPRRETPKPLLKQGAPAGLIAQAFRAAREPLTARADKPAPPPKRKEKGKEDGRQLFKPVALLKPAAERIFKRLARAVWKFTFVSVPDAGDAPPMYLDPRCQSWFNPGQAAGFSITAGPGSVSRPAACSTGPPSLRL